MSQMIVREQQPRRPTVGGEAVARLQAEGRLIRRYESEFRKFLSRGDRVSAVRALVKKHGPEYGEMVRELRERAQAWRADQAETAA